ncbi:MAG: hypothetical protein P8P99_00525 [Maricaulis sp.]|nr:hypothetical protein [Maricaulis sp.]
MIRLSILTLVALLISSCVSITSESVSEMSGYDLCRFSGPGWITTAGEDVTLNDELKARGIDCYEQHALERERLNRVFASYGSGYSGPTGYPSADAQQGNACLTYVATGQRYRVDARVMSGNELNQATGSYNYPGWARHVVVFWGPGQATIIQMNAMFSDELPAISLHGTDQQDREWQVSRAGPIC